ncbi:MAG: chemotaxis protein CheA, partial [Actinomycetota bacterium]|nr:chemotaxis protein CheA [Actinomycetota bacterium]
PPPAPEPPEAPAVADEPAVAAEAPSAPADQPAAAGQEPSSVPTSSSMSRSGAMEVTDRPGAEMKSKGVSDTSIRVDVGLLDNLMTLVGELVLARNQIMQMVSTSQDTNMAAVAQRLNLITTELQEGAMKTRMQPIGNLWSKFPRIVRDLAVACEKSVRLEMEGQDTELDKTIIEAIRDPLTHLVRNAVDHGIEPPDARNAVGKHPEGRLSLRAYHEGGTVTIEISDDGGGIDPEKLRANAVAKNVIASNKAATMSERELLQLIFAPGFSTAPKVTNVSGRGVGMDVVRTNIEKIGGTVDVQSTIGQGTVLRIKIPLTLAIIPALVIASGEERYAIPQISLVELVRLDGAEARNAVETIHGAPVYRLRGRLLPLVYLHEVLGTKEPDPSGSVNIVVLQADDRQFGLVVEGVRDSAEIVVKPLGHHLKGIPTFAGATMMGDGLVGLILDVMGLAQLAHVVGADSEKGSVDKVATAAEQAGERQALLLFATPDDGRMAIPLAAVDRLEEFSLDNTEAVGSQDVIQYRGQIMPLVHVSSVLPERRMDMRSYEEMEERRTMHVVVHRVGERRVGLVVDRIHDIVEDNLVLAPASRAFTLGTVVVNDRVTEVIDLPAVLDAAGLNDRTIEMLGAA